MGAQSTGEVSDTSRRTDLNTTVVDKCYAVGALDQ